MTPRRVQSAPDRVADRGQERKRKFSHVVKILLLGILIPVFCLCYCGRCLWSKCSGQPMGFYRDTVAMQRERQQRKMKELRKETPPALPAVRKRSLTLPLSPTTTRFWERKQQGTADQLQSSLFGRCPLEIRQLIYKYYLSCDERCVHVFRRTDRRLGHYLCNHTRHSHYHTPPPQDWGYSQMTLTATWQTDMNIVPKFSNRILPLLKTCQRV